MITAMVIVRFVASKVARVRLGADVSGTTAVPKLDADKVIPQSDPLYR